MQNTNRQVKHHGENLRLGKMNINIPTPSRVFQNDKKCILPVVGYQRKKDVQYKVTGRHL